MKQVEAMDAAILEKEALLFPDTERALLVGRLLESISPCPSAVREAWIREADERMRAFHEGEISAVDGSQAMKELRRGSPGDLAVFVSGTFVRKLAANKARDRPVTKFLRKAGCPDLRFIRYLL